MEISISEISRNNWDLGSRRVIFPIELEDWHKLVTIFPTLSESADSVIWPHSASGRFSVKPLSLGCLLVLL